MHVDQAGNKKGVEVGIALTGTDEYKAKGEKMSQYVEKACTLIQEFESYEIAQIPRAMNEEAGALEKLATQGSASDSIPVIQIQTQALRKETQSFK